MRDERTIYTTVVDFGFVFTPQAISLVQPDSYVILGRCMRARVLFSETTRDIWISEHAHLRRKRPCHVQFILFK